MAIKQDVYPETIDRMEPNIAMVDTGAALASISISLRRIADALAHIIELAERGETHD